MRSRYGEHSTGVQRLPRHNPANAPPPVWTSVMGSLFSLPNFSSSLLNSPYQGCLPCAVIWHKHSAVLFRYGMGDRYKGASAQPWNYVRYQPCKVVYKMPWNNVAFSFLWLFTGLCQSVSCNVLGREKENFVGGGRRGICAWSVSTLRSLILVLLWN